MLRGLPKVGVPSGHANCGNIISKSPLTVGRAEYFGRRESEAGGGGFGYFLDLLLVKRSFVLREFWHVSPDDSKCEGLLREVVMMFV